MYAMIIPQVAHFYRRFSSSWAQEARDKRRGEVYTSHCVEGSLVALGFGLTGLLHREKIAMVAVTVAVYYS